MITLPFDVPVDPDAPDAHDWLVEELSKPAYQAAQPTLFDRIAKAISDWFGSLQIGTAEGPPAVVSTIVVALVIAAIVVAILIFGLPRLNRRSKVTGALFGDDDDRTAERLREDAQAAAAAGDWSSGVILLFRAIARSLAERTLVSTTPGTTARDFAARTGTVFPPLAPELVEAARSFDTVRYLGREGTEEQYRQIVALDRDLRSARPALETSSV